MRPKEFRLTGEQAAQLERIAAANGRQPSELVDLAVDALIAEAVRHDGWLPLPSPETPQPRPRAS